MVRIKGREIGDGINAGAIKGRTVFSQVLPVGLKMQYIQYYTRR